jgi:phosphohistidine phosphatase SixA
MLVGHMPHLDRLLHLMTGLDEQTTTARFPLHGMIALESSGDAWKQTWRIGS